MKNRLIALYLLLTVSFFGSSFQFFSDRTTVVLKEGEEYTQLIGNARIISEHTSISADKIELFGPDFIYARCTGSVEVYNSEQGIRLYSETLFYNRSKSYIRVEGYVEMLDLKNELVVKGNYLEDDGEAELTIIQVGVRILKEDLTCRSEFARFYRGQNRLELSGLPLVIYKGDEFRAERISINMDTDDIQMHGSVSGSISRTKVDDADSEDLSEGAAE